MFGSRFKDLNCPVLKPSPYFQLGQVQNTFKRLYFGLNFLCDLAKGSEAEASSA